MVLVWLFWLLAALPSNVRPAMMAMATRTAATAYSLAIAPDSHFKNAAKCCRIVATVNSSSGDSLLDNFSDTEP